MALRDLATGKGDLYRFDPKTIFVDPEFNSRDMESEDNQAHINIIKESIREEGLKQPVTVAYDKDEGRVFLTDGFCRMAAITALLDEGFEVGPIPALIEKSDATIADRIFSQVVRNGGKPFGPLEQGRVFKRLVQQEWSVGDIARKSGFSRVHVQNLIDLEAMPKAVTKFVEKGQVSATLVIELMKKKKGDKKKVAESLKLAVEEAKRVGKDRATLKHVPRDPEEENEPQGGSDDENRTPQSDEGNEPQGNAPEADETPDETPAAESKPKPAKTEDVLTEAFEGITVSDGPDDETVALVMSKAGFERLRDIVRANRNKGLV